MSSRAQQDEDLTATYNLSARILTTAILSVALVVIVLIILHIYVRCVLRRSYLNRHGTIHIVRVNGSESDQGADMQTVGLDAAAIAALPTFSYENNGGGGAVDCPICLSAVSEGEMVRALPNCKHLFHVECVDMWLGSHTTCPLCRAAVGPAMEEPGLVSRIGSSLRRMMSRDRSRRVVQAEEGEDLERGNNASSR